MKTIWGRARFAIACGTCFLILAVVCVFAGLFMRRPVAGPVSISFEGWTNSGGVTLALFRFTNCGAAQYSCQGDLEAAELRESGSTFAGSFAGVLKGHSVRTLSLAVTANTNSWRVGAAIYARIARPNWQHQVVSRLDGIGVHIYGGGENHPIRIFFGGYFTPGLDPALIRPFTNSWIITNSLPAR